MSFAPFDPLTPSTGNASIGNARASVVNRVHRVVRAEAVNLREQRRRLRSLWVPIGIFSMLMLGIVYAVWGLLDNYDGTPNGIPDASDQVMLLLVWSLPVAALLVGAVWLQRSRSRAAGDGMNGEVSR